MVVIVVVAGIMVVVGSSSSSSSSSSLSGWSGSQSTITAAIYWPIVPALDDGW
jgi:hypothetical protein